MQKVFRIVRLKNINSNKLSRQIMFRIFVVHYNWIVAELSTTALTQIILTTSVSESRGGSTSVTDGEGEGNPCV